ncbi:MAG: septum formation initiator family protein [Sphingobacteriaceae bacterium]|nr:septum formation initiator family protein [Sphingobacteriaceae bacterium]
MLKVFKNKYFLTCVAILAWLLFFDKNDVFSQWELIQKCKKLEKERNYYIHEIAENRFHLNELATNKKSLETFAREKYLMKKDNEDVFVFVTK